MLDSVALVLPSLRDYRRHSRCFVRSALLHSDFYLPSLPVPVIRPVLPTGRTALFLASTLTCCSLPNITFVPLHSYGLALAPQLQCNRPLPAAGFSQLPSRQYSSPELCLSLQSGSDSVLRGLFRDCSPRGALSMNGSVCHSSIVPKRQPNLLSFLRVSLFPHSHPVVATLLSCTI